MIRGVQLMFVSPGLRLGIKNLLLFHCAVASALKRKDISFWLTGGIEPTLECSRPYLARGPRYCSYFIDLP